LGSYILVVAPMGVKFGTEEGTEVYSEADFEVFRPAGRWNLARRRGPLVPSSLPNFTPIGATCRRCGAKNLKIGLWVN